MAESEQNASISVENRPGVLVVGAPDVGKRTLISRLLSVDFPETSDLSEGVLCQGWTIETKYYLADISVWTAHLAKGFSLGSLPITKELQALVMVFDMSDEPSFTALQDWISTVDIQNFEILLCVGNKVDLVPGHNAHTDYRRYLEKRGESFSDTHPEFLDYGIDRTEGCSLLGDEEPSFEMKKSILKWCSQHNFEFIEACASNAEFDKCLSVDGDIQGLERVYGALSAHMWPGMVLKTGNRVTAPTLMEKEDVTDDESDYEIEYEVLSGGSFEDLEGAGESSSSFNNGVLTSTIHEVTREDVQAPSNLTEDNIASSNVATAVATASGATTNEDVESERGLFEKDKLVELRDDKSHSSEADEDMQLGYEDLERLMGEISNMRSNLRLMPDFQRREMAANLALEMASMFGDMSDEDGV